MQGWTEVSRKLVAQLGGVMRANDGAGDAPATGLVAGTRIATASGWRDAAKLGVGDMVLTFDNGLQPITDIQRNTLWSGRGACPPSLWPLAIPQGALDNAMPMRILPGQAVMLESDIAERVLGDPFVLFQARNLIGLRDIWQVQPDRGLEVVSLAFGTDQIVIAAQGAHLLCPAGQADAEPQAHGPYRLVPDKWAKKLVMAA